MTAEYIEQDLSEVVKWASDASGDSIKYKKLPNREVPKTVVNHTKNRVKNKASKASRKANRRK